MHTIVALGNPGADYEKTRHNAGRLILNDLVRQWNLPKLISSSRLGGAMSEGVVENSDIRVFFPGTFMNESGRAVVKALGAGEQPDLIVVYDEIDLPLGEFKLSYGRGSGGHNGLRSIIDSLKTPNFLRVRVGIAHRTLLGRVVRPTGDQLARYVLGQFSGREEKKLLALSGKIGEAIMTAVKEGKDQAMNRFN